MPSRFELPHIDISAFRTDSPYQGSSSGGDGAIRSREEHGQRLQNELNAALELADAVRPTDERLPETKGTHIEVELRRGTKADILERKTKGIRPGAVKATEDNERTVALYVPDSARAVLQEILHDYTDGALTEGGKPRRAGSIEPIEAFRQARLETFWTDQPEALPQASHDEIWWALWCVPDAEARLEEACARLDLRIASRDRRLYFPETTVLPVFGMRAAIELLLFMTGDIDELRRASDNPTFFTDEVRGDQREWVEDLATRITWPHSTAPAVCVLDTGVNRAHMLIEPALSETDQHSVDSSWGVDDHHSDGHGTAMAGMSLHGDLTAQLSDESERVLEHRLESVKLLPPAGFDPNDPQSYGAITQAAIALPEIAAPERTRVYCMAVSNHDVSGSIPSAWSAAVDQAAAGVMTGDEETAPKRLLVLSTGNIAPSIDTAQIFPQDDYPAEDPAQAWNALTVGGYTELTDITEQGYEDWTPMVDTGELSPHTRTSVTWPQSRSPFKPELVLEAGNRAVSPSGSEALTMASLSLLSTGKEVDRLPLIPFEATSAATSQVARMAARLTAAHPDSWPETIRALMVHSAEWTEPMTREFERSGRYGDHYGLVRKYGYGVPDFDRANASAQNDLALIAQSRIQPFRLEGQRKFNECHYYDLPLPVRVLEQMNNEIVQLKITLSYFVEPNPGLSANVDPQRYQSHGLRFDLRRKGETHTDFKKGVNASERENPRASWTRPPDDNRWLLGPKSVSAGSLHCDVWTGPAVELLGRDSICVYPVVGWWRERARAEYCNKETRYSLVVTIKTPDVDIDLYTPIQTMIQVGSDIETEI